MEAKRFFPLDPPNVGVGRNEGGKVAAPIEQDCIDHAGHGSRQGCKHNKFKADIDTSIFIIAYLIEYWMRIWVSTGI